MPDTMEAFWRGLSDFADTAVDMSGCGCNSGLGEQGELGASNASTDATEAMSKVLKRYVELSLQGESLRQMMVAGVKIPCEVWAAYASARQDYLTKSQEVFDQLSKRGVTVEQVIYSQGKPAVDPTDPNKVRTLRVNAPLRPPAFVGLNCPGVANMQGASFAGDIGWERMPISLGFIPIAAAGAAVAACTAATLGACLVLVGAGSVILGIAGYAGYKIMKQVAVAIREYESSPSKTVAAYTSCFQSLTKGGLSAADAVKQCQGSQTSAQQYAKDRGDQDNKGFGFWAWLGVGAAVVVVGGIVVRVLRSRAAAAAALISPIPLPVGEATQPRRHSRPRGILMGDLYLHPHEE